MRASAKENNVHTTAPRPGSKGKPCDLSRVDITIAASALPRRGQGVAPYWAKLEVEMSQHFGWKQTGNNYLWKYLEKARHYPGWNLTADPDGARSMLDLLNLFVGATWSCVQSVATARPTPSMLRIPCNRSGAAKCYSRRELLIRYPNTTVNDIDWSLADDGHKLTLTLDLQHMKELLVALHRGLILKEDRDWPEWTIGPDEKVAPDDQLLTVWHYPD